MDLVQNEAFKKAKWRQTDKYDLMSSYCETTFSFEKIEWPFQTIIVYKWQDS